MIGMNIRCWWWLSSHSTGSWIGSWCVVCSEVNLGFPAIIIIARLVQRVYFGTSSVTRLSPSTPNLTHPAAPNPIYDHDLTIPSFDLEFDYSIIHLPYLRLESIVRNGPAPRCGRCRRGSSARESDIQWTPLMARRKANTYGRALEESHCPGRWTSGHGPGGDGQRLVDQRRKRACGAQSPESQGQGSSRIHGMLFGGCFENLRSRCAVYSYPVKGMPNQR